MILFRNIIIILCLSYNVFTIAQAEELQKVILIGESHFVAEKYDEIEQLFINNIDSLAPKSRVLFLLELPSSINYAFIKFEEEGDSSMLYNWFDHIYEIKNYPISYFWTDYRDMIFCLYRHAKEKNVDLQLRGIDIELEFRRTVYILSYFESDETSVIKNLLRLDLLERNKKNRKIIKKQVSKLLIKTKKDSLERRILLELRRALKIDCTVCYERDKFMAELFISYSKSRPYNIIFGSFGLDHIVYKHDFSDVSDAFKTKHKIVLKRYKSLINHLHPVFGNKIYRIGIMALHQNYKLSNGKKEKFYRNIFNEKELEFLKEKLGEEDVLRISTHSYKDLENSANELDYIIIYENSSYK